MREALFRGQRICQKLAEKGEWVYGAFIPDPREALEGRVRGVGFIWQWEPEIGRKKMFVVGRNTVGPWTGRTDCKGVRIFEGDLVRHRDAVYRVQYLSDMTRFAAVRPNGTFEPAALADCEVVGNVYDNPELLEVET